MSPLPNAEFRWGRLCSIAPFARADSRRSTHDSDYPFHPPTLLPESDSIIGCARESPATRVVDQAICPPSPDISDVNRGNHNSRRGQDNHSWVPIKTGSTGRFHAPARFFDSRPVPGREERRESGGGPPLLATRRRRRRNAYKSPTSALRSLATNSFRFLAAGVIRTANSGYSQSGFHADVAQPHQKISGGHHVVVLNRGEL